MTHQYDPLAWDTVPLDMDHVTRAALGMRAWHLEYDCQGVPFTWRGQAGNESAADSLARHALSVTHHGFNTEKATLTACLEFS